MKRLFFFSLAALTCVAAPDGFAATEAIDVTVYGVQVRPGEPADLPNGAKVVPGGLRHSTVVNKKTGEVTSQWCSGVTHLDSAGKQTNQAGSCDVYYDDGTLLFLSYFATTMDVPSTWSVMGGTGRYTGATGGGSCKADSQRGDGMAWTSSCTGSITTK